MVQMMPRDGGFIAPPPTTDSAPTTLRAEDLVQGTAEEDWRRTSMLLHTATPEELAGSAVQPPDLLVRLFHEEGPRVFAAQPVRFGCSCSEEKVRQSLSIYSARDIATMTTPEGIVTADCQFCGAHYRLDPASVGFEATTTPPDAQGGDGDAQH